MFKEYIRSYKDLLKPHDKMMDADFGRALGAERISFHWVQLPPGERSSYPHAESIEEEFVYVVSGNPHVWIDGYIYELRPGLAVGFPSGTGIAHCLINNTSQMAELIVLGEPTKKDNQFVFPINPELKENHSNNWWKLAPKKNLGPHDAKVGNLNFLRDHKEIPFIYDVNSEQRADAQYYKGDCEKFTQGVRLTNKVGLKTLGVWHERLLPERRTSWPHAHKFEEEALVLIKGSATVWLNGFVHDIQPGDAVFFKPNSGISHVIINDSEEVAEFIGIGEAQDFEEGDKVFYPLHDSRNQQCVEEGYFWNQSPRHAMGLHTGLPIAKNMHIDELDSVDEFLSMTNDLLYQKEDEYSLLLGLCELRQRTPSKPSKNKYFVIKRNENILGAAFLSEKSLILPNISSAFIVPLVDYLVQNQIQIPEVVGNSFTAECFVRLYATATKKTSLLSMDQKIYSLNKVSGTLNTDVKLQLARSHDEEKTVEYFHGFCQEALPNEKHDIEKLKEFIRTKIQNNEVYVLLNKENKIVSMNFVGRPTRNGISISGVYTPKELRGQGYASAVVALTSQKMLDQGKKFCVLYTDTANPTSNSIYQKIGYKEIASSRHYLLKS